MAAHMGRPMGVAEKAMSNNTPQSKGEDIRRGFLGHLIKAFPRKQINAFVDDKLKRGDDISASLVEAIEGSSISLVIFSENYAFSHWCLEELVKIIECNEKYGQIVIPVFYGIDPTDVRHQKKSYENAFSELEKRYNSSQVQIWRHALNKSANLSGITSNFRNDAELLEEIIKHVLMSLSKHPVNSKGLVGIDKSISHLESLLQKDSKKVRVIGIWGMGGIGKTTIADKIFSQNRYEYDGSCFLENVSEKLTRHDGMKFLKETLFSELLKESVKDLSSDIERRIGRMKVLIVLDDVKDTSHLEMLFGTLDWYRSDSRIIVTTRDKQVLIANKVDELYEVGVLDSIEAFALFNLNAFDRSHLETEFSDLSKRVVNYAKGIPLVLNVLAHMLCGKDKEVWESQLDKLKRLPIQKVYDVMRVSYDDLDRLEQKYFLDIACFFNGLSVKVDYMKLLLKDYESDNAVAVGLERLKDKALITISEDNVISMHDILQEMGREVVRQESSQDPRKCSRLWDLDIICDVLKNDKDLVNLREVTLSDSKYLKELPDFSKATNLESPGFVSIPSSIINLTRLRKLEIRFCSNLLSLPVLPSSLKILLVQDVPLKSVLFPSTVTEQFKENKKRIEFWNCLNLDIFSLINIRLNVQINLMKFTHQRLSTLEHDKFESYVDYKDKFDSDQAVYVYPGSSVPEWLEYKTTKNNMIVDLSPPHLSPLLGFVFCFVLSEGTKFCDEIELNITTIDVEDDSEKDGVDIYMHVAFDLKSDHVCMIYDQRCSQYLTRIAKNQTRFKIKVTARDMRLKRREVKLKGFGISPINQSTYHNLIQ
nr:nodulation protein [Melilotus officinalis]